MYMYIMPGFVLFKAHIFFSYDTIFFVCLVLCSWFVFGLVLFISPMFFFYVFIFVFYLNFFFSNRISDFS
jgi:hypothetical protein